MINLDIDIKELLKMIYAKNGPKRILSYLADNYQILENFGIIIKDDKINAIEIEEDNHRITFYLNSIFIELWITSETDRCRSLLNLGDKHLCARVELAFYCDCGE